MGLGAWAWGDPIFWGYNPSQDDELRRVFDYAVANSKSERTLFDTAELYGLGRSESLLGTFSKDCSDKVAIATKFAALPFRLSATDVVKACEASVERLGRPIDLYQIHFPNAWSNAEYWDGLAMVYDKGLVKSVGVSNYGSDALRACHTSLSQRGIALATNQIQFSLLYRWPEANGVMDTCRELNVKVLAYSPLALGFLTGKYNNTHLPDGPRSTLGKQLFQTSDFDNLIDTMKVVASHHDGATVSQVAINWARAKGTIPIPGARTISQVQQNYGALEWNLSPTDVEALDEAGAKVTTFITPDKSPFPREDIKTHLKMFDS
jgi:pyridoxine 4-dehydrogenase